MRSLRLPIGPGSYGVALPVYVGISWLAVKGAPDSAFVGFQSEVTPFDTLAFVRLDPVTRVPGYGFHKEPWGEYEWILVDPLAEGDAREVDAVRAVD